MASRVPISVIAVASLTIMTVASSRPSGQASAAPPAIQQAPPRDLGPPSAKTGTAVIRGRIIAADTGRPLRRVQINLTAPELGREGLSTSTDDEGRYELTELPAGRFTLAVQRNGYLPLRYGQGRPLEQGKPLELADRQVIENIDFALARMGLITGRITDELGEPIAGVWVTAMRSVYWNNRRQLAPNGPLSTTDDAGEYRIGGLVPGTYIVMARTLEKWTVESRSREETETMSYAPTYFPSVSSVAEARRITVESGQEVSNTDFSLVPGRAATISGTALDSQRRPLKLVLLSHQISGPNGGLVGIAGNGTVAADGTFTVANVPPGEYKLQATGPQESAWLPIAVNSVDIDNVTLTTSAGWSVTGTVTTEGGAAVSIPRNQVSVSAVRLADISGMGMQGGVVSRQIVNPDWTFSVSGIVGPARLRVTLPEGWIMKAMLQGDRDISDVPLEMNSGEELAGVQMILTDRVAGVTGQLLDEKGAPISDGTVVVFAADQAKWFENSRFVRAVRPDQQGRYQIRGMLPGEYLAVAVDYAEQGIWNDPEYLESIRKHAQKVTLGEGEPQTLSLKLVSP